LPTSVIKRLPVRFTFDNNYFNDLFQGIPVGGYTGLVKAMLEGIEVRLDMDFLKCRSELESLAKKIVYTGPIDEFFSFRLGTLEYRSLRFETELLDCTNFQGNAVVNYTSHEKPYTRIIEHKHFEMFGDAVYACPKTVVSEEYSVEYAEGMEPYYPVNDERNNAIAEEYRRLASQEDGVIFGGRLGQYRYFDMAPVIEQVLGLDI
jgi:UDP-galactopyranose mutase